jgi:phenylpropionate dioxygenase-like ring-hydroxylating dioxygenase large terminal subunit
MNDEDQTAWVDAGPEANFEPSAGTRIDMCGHAVALFRRPDGAFIALADRCPHAGAPLSAGVLREGQIVCAWHGWSFTGDGKCTSVPSTAPIPKHDVRVEAGRVLVKRQPGA